MEPTITNPDISRSWLNFSVLLLIAAHLAIVLPQAYLLNIWVDEASSLYATQNGFWTAFQNAAVEQKQAPLYFWILSLWRSIDDSIFFARLFSVFCTIASIRIFAGLAWGLLGPRAALILTAFFALHPYLVWASLEIRVYSLVILLTIILLRLYLTAFSRENSSDSRLRYPNGWFLITAIIALYTNYYLGFLLVGLFISLLVLGKFRPALRYAGLMAVAGLAFLPLLVGLYSEFRSKTGGYQEARTIIEGLRIIWNHVLTFMLPTEIFTGSESSAASVIRLWLMRGVVIILVIMAVVKRRQISSMTISLGVIAGVASVGLLTAYFLIGHQFVEIRHASILFVPLLLFVGSLIADILKDLSIQRSRLLVLAAGIVVLGSFAYSITSLYPNLTKRGDWSRVAAFIESNESPGQPIVTFEAFDALALPCHYNGVNAILPDDNYFDFGLQAPYGSKESLVRQNDHIISEIPRDAGSVWLVVNELCISTEACRPLENFVDANYTIELEQEFYLSKVYLLRRKDHDRHN